MRSRGEPPGGLKWLLAVPLVALLAGCGRPAEAPRDGASSAPAKPASAVAEGAASGGAASPSHSGPAPKPGGGLLAEPSGAEGVLAISIRWSSKIVTGDANVGVTTTVYERTAQLVCPVTSGDEASTSYFATFDRPNADPMAATGSYQPWWNEDCTGSLTVDDTYHADDPTLAGPEPVVRTRGTRPLRTPDTPLTVETDLNRARTRYMFIAPGTDGFQQEAAPGYDAKLVKASAAPMATIDVTVEGPIGGGKREIAVPGGTVKVEWTFTRGKSKP